MLIDGLQYYRVTQILEPFNGLSAIDPFILERAAERGTRVHAYIELFLTGLFCPSIDQDVVGYFSSFKAWFDAMVEEVLHCEIRLHCKDLRITGAIDCIARLKGDKGLTIVDFKTPQTPSKTWRLQTAAYQKLCSINQIEIARRICLQLDKNAARAKVHEYTEHQSDWLLYKGALEAYKYFNPLKN